MSKIYCYHCGAENARRRWRCHKCHKWLRPVDKNATEFGKNYTEGKLKDDFTEKFFDKLTMFIQKHAFGLLFSCTLIAGILPNVLVHGQSDDVQTVTTMPVFVAETEEAPEEVVEEEPAEEVAEEVAEEKEPEAPAAPVEEAPVPEPEVVKPTPAATGAASFENVLTNYFAAQSAVASRSDFNNLNNSNFTAAERSALLGVNVVPLAAGSFSREEHAWVAIRPINTERAGSVVYNALDTSRYQIGDYTQVGRAEYLLEVYACRTAPCAPPQHSWSLTNVREISYYYVMLISLTNPSTSDTVYYHLITSTNIPTSYTESQYFFASAYVPDEDASKVYNFSQWFAYDWYPYNYTN